MPRRPRGYYGARRASMRAGRGMKPSFRRGAPRYQNQGCGCFSTAFGFLCFIAALWVVLVGMITSRPDPLDPYGPYKSTIFTWILLPVPIYIIIFYIFRLVTQAKKRHMQAAQNALQQTAQVYSDKKSDEIATNPEAPVEDTHIPKMGYYTLKHAELGEGSGIYILFYLNKDQVHKVEVPYSIVKVNKGFYGNHSTVLFQDSKVILYIRREDSFGL